MSIQQNSQSAKEKTFSRMIKVYENGKFIDKEFLISKENPCCSMDKVFPFPLTGELFSFLSDKLSELFILPGFVDVHVHLREPGFSYKETIETGTAAAAAGGFTDVCSMPNINPAPDSVENLKIQSELIDKHAKVHVYPYGCITRSSKGEMLSDMDNLAEQVIAFTDDGKGVQQDDMMLAAMLKAKSLGKMIVAHCEDERYGTSPESEYLQVERDLKLVSKTGCKYHLCHASTKESIQLIRDAKKAGLPVSAETAPHYLVFCDEDVKDSGDFKMNPPIRKKADQEALIQGICDGTIDMIATDHAPHSAEEKGKGFKNSLNGIVGLETAFPLIYTNFVKKGIITFGQLIDLMSNNPRKIFNIPSSNKDGILVEVNAKHIVKREEFRTMGRSMPYDGMEVYGKCLATFINGRMVQ